MLIKEEDLQHWIDNFYGYGSWHARFWFVAHEEGGGEVPEEVADKLSYFREIAAHKDGVLCNIREMYARVGVTWEGRTASSFNDQYEYRFGANAVQHGVWKNLISFLHGYKGEDVPDVMAYQRHCFLSPSAGGQALIRLYPLPASHSHAWYYNWLGLRRIDFLKSRKLYQERLYEHRMQTILSNLRVCEPRVVLMYGMENINRLKGSVRMMFPEAKFKAIKATKRTIPQHHRADVGATTILLTTQIPALRHNRVETGFDWEEFGRSVAS